MVRSATKKKRFFHNSGLFYAACLMDDQPEHIEYRRTSCAFFAVLPFVSPCKAFARVVDVSSAFFIALSTKRQ
ncbi:hypothetical protein SINU_05435 [Sporolactobacillus inulinus CASD]|uniref:Uncharacterized protein n=1 Tax=Sporolactobacillus inulinus CASD TaxID=1069536 RepID=A0A0U1QQB6_9BACL|nr:hypothetical protein SINU_05435 [Sporolactobacillus inulinus CASD]